MNHDGLGNDVVIINDQRVVRFAKHAYAKQLLRQEAHVLALACQHVTMRLPLFVHVAEDFVAYDFIPGEGLHRNDILAQDTVIQDRLAQQLATFLHQLHTIPHATLRSHHLPRSDAVRTRADWLQLLQDVERELFPFLSTFQQQWIRRHFTPILDGHLNLEYVPVLIHGDLGPSHILYDRTAGSITGIIDFGIAGLGDPATDVASIIYAFGESFLRRMTPWYPHLSALIDRARFRAGTLELQWARLGVRTKDFSWLFAHVNGCGRDVMPIGSGWDVTADRWSEASVSCPGEAAGDGEARRQP
jgi:aminoglycoside 2''-phosphotransferase